MLTCAKIDRKVKTRKGSKQKRNYRLNANIPMIAFNVKYLTMPIKRQRLWECIKRYDPTICCL